MKTLLLSLFVLLGPLAGAQVPDWQWATSGGGQAAGQSIARMPNGSYTVAGHFRDALVLGGQTLVSSGDEDVLLIQYDVQGQVQWATRAGGAGHDGATASASDAAGNVYVAGYFSGSATFATTTLTSAGTDDAFLAKYSGAGTLLWVQQVGGSQVDYAAAVAVDNAGAVFVAGQYQGTLALGATTVTSPSASAGFLARYDAQGGLGWCQSLPDSFVGGLATNSAGQVYVAGTIGTAGGLLAKFSATGTWLWTSAATGANEPAAGTGVATDAQGGVYVAGRFRAALQVGNTTVVSAGSYDGFVARFDAQGAGDWVQRFGGVEEDQARGVAITGLGNVGVTGYFRGSATVGGQALASGVACTGAFVSCYDPQGTALWLRQAVGTVSAGGNGLVFEAGSEAGAVTGTYQGALAFGSTPPLPTACLDDIFTARLTTSFPDLTVNTVQAVQGSYHNVTVTATGLATLAGPLQITGTLTVQSGGSLATQCQPLTGPGSFVLAAGAELRICHPAGIAAAGATGAVQLSGPRSFSPDASYVYNGPAAQLTGPGLPGQVRALTVANAAGLSLTAPVSIVRNLQLATGDLLTNNQLLTLLSDAAGTAQVDNTGGVVQGPATVQRYIDPSRNSGSGYRHFSSPVQATTVADLATASFTPVTNPAYNTVPPPSGTTLPTVIAYDERRLALGAPGDFSQGWYSPASNSAPLEVLRGYSVQLAGNQTVDFVGTLNNGPYTATLTRGTQADAGWNLLGNPYPSTLDWSQVPVPAGLNAALYVFQSSGVYSGQYRSYVNGIGNPLIALGQGFMVQPNAASSSVLLTLTNAARVANYASAPPLNRGAARPRPLVQVSLTDAATGLGDETTIYFEAGATAQADARYDARKARPDTASTIGLASLALKGEPLAINGLPLPRAAYTVPLLVRLVRPGQYVLAVAQFASMAGLTCVLRDAATGQSVPLRAQSTYAFKATSGAELVKRFCLVFTPAQATSAQAQVRR